MSRRVPGGVGLRRCYEAVARGGGVGLRVGVVVEVVEVGEVVEVVEVVVVGEVMWR